MMTEALLVSAARAQHVEKVIRPALAAGKWVLCDRYADSTRVYQGVLGGLDTEKLETLIALSTDDLSPDLTFLLDCDVRIAARRRDQRGAEADLSDAIRRYDDAKIEFHDRLRTAYLSLVQRFPARMIVLDAAQAPAKVTADALQLLAERRFI
jgi:dTMP kinase